MAVYILSVSGASDKCHDIPKPPSRKDCLVMKVKRAHPEHPALKAGNIRIRIKLISGWCYAIQESGISL